MRRGILKSSLLVLAAATMAFTTACSSGGGSGASSDLALTEQNLNESLDLSKLNADLDEMNQSLSAYQGDLNSLSVINLGSQGDAGRGLAQKLNGIIAQILNSVDKIKEQTNELQVKLNAYLLQLDINNPDHQEAIQKINEALSYLDNVQGYICQAKDQLLSKISSVIADLDSKVDSIGDSTLKLIVNIVWQNVRVEIVAASLELNLLQCGTNPVITD